jgi:hypothetical protein
MAYFSLSGNSPWHNTALQIGVNGEIIYGKLDLIILLVISSYPLLTLVGCKILDAIFFCET